MSRLGFLNREALMSMCLLAPSNSDPGTAAAWHTADGADLLNS